MDHRGGGDRLYEMMEKGEEGNIGQHLDEHGRGRGSSNTKGDGDANGVATKRIEAEGQERNMNFSGPDAQERKARSEEEMREEADMLRRELEKDGIFSTPFPAPEDAAGESGDTTTTTNTGADMSLPIH